MTTPIPPVESISRDDGFGHSHQHAAHVNSVQRVPVERSHAEQGVQDRRHDQETLRPRRSTMTPANDSAGTLSTRGTSAVLTAVAGMATVLGVVLFTRLTDQPRRRLPVVLLLCAAGFLVRGLGDNRPLPILCAVVNRVGTALLLPSLLIPDMSRLEFADRGRGTGPTDLGILPERVHLSIDPPPRRAGPRRPWRGRRSARPDHSAPRECAASPWSPDAGSSSAPCVRAVLIPAREVTAPLRAGWTVVRPVPAEV